MDGNFGIAGEDWEDKYAVLKDLTNVHSSVSNNIKKDFTLAKLDEHDRKMVLGMVGMAFFAKRATIELLDKITYKFHNGKWYLVKMDSDRIKKIIYYSDETFNLLMNKPVITAVLKRNLKENWLVDLIGGRVRSDERVEGMQDSIVEKKGMLSKLFSNNENKEGIEK